MEFIKKCYNKYFKMKNNDYDSVYYNKIFNRYMYIKNCNICNYNIYMFNLSEFNEHQIECYKLHVINKRQIKFS